MVSAAGLIALDWGSSHLRAHRMGPDGLVLAVRQSDAGASRLSGGPAAFEAALATLVADWRAEGLPALACGMVGSAHGWCEAPYVEAPLPLVDLAAHVTRLPGLAGPPVAIVPGVRGRDAQALPDVMRGEETQLLGWASQQTEPAHATGLLVLPGTHSKWAHVSAGRLLRFDTRMTGELYALLREQSVLSRLMVPPASPDEAAFVRGVVAARAGAPHDLVHRLFTVRTLGLSGDIAPSGLADYLSGLLIGEELVAGLAQAGALAEGGVQLVGEVLLCERYQAGLQALGHHGTVHSEPLAARGLWELARRLGWCAG